MVSLSKKLTFLKLAWIFFLNVFIATLNTFSSFNQGAEYAAVLYFETVCCTALHFFFSNQMIESVSPQEAESFDYSSSSMSFSNNEVEDNEAFVLKTRDAVTSFLYFLFASCSMLRL